ncbi:hypothetical protein ADK91_02870 [Streptomyces sp. XY511]|uniref:DUF6233 domain-containing protein n=1 Tax=Streptomyces sp. XY511 TaxID=1519480 RepID=UPI0006C4BC55|nr:DUF6233 domain-containing protein [Streptomyces sp. XY511]KOV17254.1 hypothetical protein ADK91_02870 [Streptomyces sp. XY511]
MPDPASPAPRVWLTLPDGQELRGRLLARKWTPSGWRFQVSVALWSATADLGVEPADYVVWVPADVGTEYLRPVDGDDYTGVPTDGPPSHPYLAPPPPGADMSWAWTVEQTRTSGPGSRPTGTRIHEHGCPQAPADGPELDLDQALTALTRAGARACQECAAAEVLTRL